MTTAVFQGKYAPLYRHLKDTRQKEWRASFEEIERILGFGLPMSARKYSAWWANEGGGKITHTHSLAWTEAGWLATQVELAAELVLFLRDE